MAKGEDAGADATFEERRIVGVADLLARRLGDVTFSVEGLAGLRLAGTGTASGEGSMVGAWASAVGGISEASSSMTLNKCVHGPPVEELADASNPRCEKSVDAILNQTEK